MMKEHRKRLANKYIPIAIVTIMAIPLSTSISPVFAACGFFPKCYSLGEYDVTTRNGVIGNSEVFNPSFSGVDINSNFIAAPFWAVDEPSGYFVEIGWLKGKIDALPETKTSPEFYKCTNVTNSVVCKWLGSAGTSGTHTFKLEDSNQDTIWRYWIDGVEKTPSTDMPFSRARLETGTESTHGGIGTNGLMTSHFNLLQYYVGTQTYAWEWILINETPSNPDNPYYVGLCADHPEYHYKVKKGSTPSC